MSGFFNLKHVTEDYRPFFLLYVGLGLGEKWVAWWCGSGRLGGTRSRAEDTGYDGAKSGGFVSSYDRGRRGKR